jgi:hypothetical protein
MPLGEMLDLEQLAARCKELGKWTFFFSSTPANVPGMSSHISDFELSQNDSANCLKNRWCKFAC